MNPNPNSTKEEVMNTGTNFPLDSDTNPKVSHYRQLDGKAVKVMKWPDFCTDELPDYTELSGFERDRKIANRGGKGHE
jgi:hypothetical protein